MIAKALGVIAVLISVAHPPFVAFVFGVLALTAPHLGALLLFAELAIVAGLAWLIAEAVARGRAPRRLALS